MNGTEILFPGVELPAGKPDYNPVPDTLMILVLWPVAAGMAVTLAALLVVSWPLSPFIYYWWRHR